jgi:DNA-directed RNA polymerase subunit RPC12/RpoP
MKYNVTPGDRCPNCKKKVHNMMKEHGMVITIPFGVVCTNCGSHFALLDMIHQALESKEHRIIKPGEEGQEALLVQPGKV